MESVAKVESPLVRLLGIVLFILTLALSLPGIRVARADEPDMTPVGVEDFRGIAASDSRPVAPPAALGPESCDAETERDRAARSRPHLVVQLPKAEPGAAVEKDPSPFVVLNNRGYNYGPAPEPRDAGSARFDAETPPPSR